MKTPRSRFNVVKAYLAWLLVGIACWPAIGAEESDWQILHPNLSPEFTRYTIPLTYEADSGRLFYFSLNQDSQRLGEEDGAENYTDRIVFDLPELGQRYTVLFRPAKNFNLIDKENWQLLEVRFTQENGNQCTVLREGLWILGNRIEIPVTLCAQQLALVSKKDIDSTLTLQISDRGNGYRGSLTLSAKGSHQGSALIDIGKLDVSLSNNQDPRDKDRSISIKLFPFDDKIRYEAAQAKLSDMLSLGRATLVVEKIATDGSQLVLAVVHGHLGDPIESALAKNQSLPTFAGTDLIRHRLITLADLRDRAGADGWIVMVFGNLKQAMNDEQRMRFGGRPSAMDLTLEENTIQKMLTLTNGSVPVLVFVTRSFNVIDLYTRWLGTEPDYFVFSDYSDPQQALSIQTPFMRPPMYPGRDNERESLRGQFVLPDDTVSILLVNGEGNIVHIEPDAQAKLAQTLAKMKDLMQGD